MSEANSPEDRALTPAQTAHLRRLYGAFERAEKELNDFAAYLLDEHGITDPGQWQLAPDLTRFVRVGPDATGDGGGG